MVIKFLHFVIKGSSPKWHENEKPLCHTHFQKSDANGFIKFDPIETKAFGDRDCELIIKSSYLSNMKQSREVICTYESKFKRFTSKVDLLQTSYVTKAVLVGPKWFWSDQTDLNLTIMIWSRPK